MLSAEAGTPFAAESEPVQPEPSSTELTTEPSSDEHGAIQAVESESILSAQPESPAAEPDIASSGDNASMSEQENQAPAASYDGETSSEQGSSMVALWLPILIVIVLILVVPAREERPAVEHADAAKSTAAPAAEEPSAAPEKNAAPATAKEPEATAAAAVAATSSETKAAEPAGTTEVTSSEVKAEKPAATAAEGSEAPVAEQATSDGSTSKEAAKPAEVAKETDSAAVESTPVKAEETAAEPAAQAVVTADAAPTPAAPAPAAPFSSPSRTGRCTSEPLGDDRNPATRRKLLV